MSSLMIRPSTFFSDTVPLWETVNNIFDSNSFFSPSVSGSTTNRSHYMGALNVYEDNNNFYILGLFPGISPEQLDLSVKENFLTISGKYSFSNLPTELINDSTEKGSNGQKETGKPGYRTLLNEIAQGSFNRSLKLPSAVDYNKIEAQISNGVLRMVLPKAESSQVRKINVKSANEFSNSNNQVNQIEGA